jgi:hypothetical protein
MVGLACHLFKEGSIKRKIAKRAVGARLKWQNTCLTIEGL